MRAAQRIKHIETSVCLDCAINNVENPQQFNLVLQSDFVVHLVLIHIPQVVTGVLC